MNNAIEELGSYFAHDPQLDGPEAGQPNVGPMNINVVEQEQPGPPVPEFTDENLKKYYTTLGKTLNRLDENGLANDEDRINLCKFRDAVGIYMNCQNIPVGRENEYLAKCIIAYSNANKDVPFNQKQARNEAQTLMEDPGFKAVVQQLMQQPGV